MIYQITCQPACLTRGNIRCDLKLGVYKMYRQNWNVPTRQIEVVTEVIGTDTVV